MGFYLSILLAVVLALFGAALIFRGPRNSWRGLRRERLIFIRNKTWR